MIKKTSKLLLLAVATFFIAIVPTFAMELSYEELEKIILKYEPDAESAYVIGEYVFTSAHTLLPQDYMLAARTIKVDEAVDGHTDQDAIFGKMTIHFLDGEFNDDGETTGFTIEDNKVGTTKITESSTFNVSYVDYNPIQLDSSLSVSVETSEQMVEDLKKYNYDVVLDSQENIAAVPSKDDPRTIKLSGTVHHIEDLDNWAKDKQTGYYVAFEVVIPEEYDGQAKWWFGVNPSHQMTHDKKNYAVYNIDKDAAEKTFEIWVDFDGDGTTYEPTCYVFDYSDIEFVAQVSMGKISDVDQTLKDVYSKNFKIDTNDFLTIDESSSKHYSITGNIHYNPEVTFSTEKDELTNYYIPVAFEIDKNFAQTATITISKHGKTKTAAFKDVADNGDKNIIALLFAVSPDDQDKTFTITIDLDGDDTNYAPTDYVFDYSKAVFLEKPEAEVSATGKTENKETYASVMETFEFEGNQETLDIAVEGDTITLTGELVNKEYKFNGAGQAGVDGYYFQYVIEISGDAASSSITIPTGPDTTKKIPYEDYDFQDKNGVSGIVVLHKLNPGDGDKSFTVTVDLDGDGEPDKTYTFNYGALELGKNSAVSVAVSADSIDSTDKETFKGWGFPEEALKLTTIENNVISGTIPYVENISSSAFTGEDVTGNYMIYTIQLKDANTEGNAEVKLQCTSGSECVDGWKIVKPTAKEDLSILHSIKVNEDGSIDDIVAYVDLDGFSNNPQDGVAGIALEPGAVYLPYEIRLTFAEDITVQKKPDGHDSIPTEMAKEAAQGIKDSYNYEEPKDQNVTVSYSENTITISGKAARNTKVTGWGGETSGYYVPFSLKFDAIYKDITIQMPRNKNLATYDNFDTEDEIGVLFQIWPNGDSKTAEITVDLDGEGTEYEPYKITVDYSGVTFLSDDMTVKALPESSKASFEAWMVKKGYTDYKYNDTFAFEEGEDHRIKVTGQSKKVTKGDASEYHLIYFLAFDKKYEDITITIGSTKHTQSAFDTGSDGKFLTVNSVITKDSPKEVTIVVDYDGEKTVYEPTTYTLDLTEVTFEE